MDDKAVNVPVDVRPDVLRSIVINDTFNSFNIDSSGCSISADQPAGEKKKTDEALRICESVQKLICL